MSSDSQERGPGTASEPRGASVADVAVTISITIGLLGLSVFMFGSDSSSGANQIALVIGAVLATIVGIKNGHSWKVIERNIVDGIATAMPAILILFSVGSLIGVWMLSGTVPTMIYYGLLLLDPSVFYPATCLLCAIVALSIGSSWTVASTLGVALIGVAGALGLSIEITAGAVISGAYFGDKMSPLSDTTNLAPAVTGIDIFTHIRAMVWTTTPSFLFALAAFAFIGLSPPEGDNIGTLEQTLTLLQENFHIGPLMLLPVALVVFLAARKVPAVAAILAGVALGAVMALLFQRRVILEFAGSPETSAMTELFKGVWEVLFDGYTGRTGGETLDALLSRGGMSSMLNTVWLIITAMCFGSAMEKAGILQRLVQSLVAFARSTGGLIATTITTCFGVNALAADQYMSIVITGRMFRDEYRSRGLHPKNLSRVLEDSGTITSPLVPWNTCGAYMAAALGVPTLAYLPFCFFNLVNPFVSMAYGYTGFKIEHGDDALWDDPDHAPRSAEGNA
ncbi:MAG: Na+/H+ antiporter NhaC [Gammaproteobacteria bacterium]|nr:Na+/H+ antiporter NhaC [Gammaproteobacteria bacterium]